jgi:ankyrin repeat protein
VSHNEVLVVVLFFSFFFFFFLSFLFSLFSNSSVNAKLLFGLIAEGNLKELKKTKAKFSLEDFSAYDAKGRTALHAATVSGRADIVEWVLARGADVNGRTQVVTDGGKIVSGGETSLMIASAIGSLSCVRALLKAKAFPSERRPGDGLAAINLACKRRDNDLVQALISFGANPENAGIDGSFPLLDSCIRGDMDCVSIIVCFVFDCLKKHPIGCFAAYCQGCSRSVVA